MRAVQYVRWCGVSKLFYPLFLQNYSADDAVQQISRMMRNDTDSNEKDLDEDIMDDL